MANFVNVLSPISENEQHGNRADQSNNNGEGGDSESPVLSLNSSNGGNRILNIKPSPKPHQTNSAKWEAIKAVMKRHKGALDERFKVIRKIGEGSVGYIFLCRLVDTNLYFTLKAMNRSHLERMNKVKSIDNEVEILQMLDHPFLPTLYHTFQLGDKCNVLVMDYCPGGDLYGLQQVQPWGCFSENDARFHASEVLIALEYLHMLGIVYRDLKPENILVKEDGHIVLTDFDLAKRGRFNPTVVRFPPAPLRCITEGGDFAKAFGCFDLALLRLGRKKNKRTNPHPFEEDHPYHNGNINGSGLSAILEVQTEPIGTRSMSVVGTYEYLAPKIAEGKVHGSAVNWWGFGVLLYEFLFGKTPFVRENVLATSMNIRQKAPMFPPGAEEEVSDAAKDLIKRLLVKDPTKRLGYRRGAAEIKQHPFFHGVNWTLIFQCCPPVIPGPYCGQDEDDSDSDSQSK